MMSEASARPDVLVVDDDEIFIERLSRHLRSSDLNAVFFLDPSSALKEISVGSVFQAVFVDLNMPQMNGIEFLRQLGPGHLAPGGTLCLTSEVDLPLDESLAMQKVGAIFHEKDFLRQKAYFLHLLQAPQLEASANFKPVAST